MAISLKRTGNIANAKIKTLVYSDAGAGKTTLIPTMPNVFGISAEGGFLSIAESDIPYAEVSSFNDLNEVYEWVTESDEAKDFESIALDSITEIAEVVLSNEKKNCKDGRAAYGEMGDKMQSIIRAFRDLDKHVYFTSQLDKMKDENTGKLIFAPSMPGAKLSGKLPYFFDEVYALRVEKDGEGNAWRGLLTQPDGMWTAKSRSGKLDQWESADLGAVMRKIQGKEA